MNIKTVALAETGHWEGFISHIKKTEVTTILEGSGGMHPHKSYKPHQKNNQFLAFYKNFKANGCLNLL